MNVGSISKTLKRWTLAVTVMTAGCFSAHATLIVDGWTLIDNSFSDDANGTFATSGSWSNTGGPDAPDWAGDSLFDSNNASTGGFALTTFLGLANGTYEVAASWSASANRSQAIPYTIQGSETVFINQENIADDFVLNDGVGDIPFKMLTSTAVVSDGTLTVRMDDVANAGSDYAIADAVAIRAIPEPGALGMLGFGFLMMMVFRRMSADSFEEKDG